MLSWIRAAFQKARHVLFYWRKPVRETTRSADQLQPPAPALNRQQRRANDRQVRYYERQRKKFDKFVTPQGPTPKKREKLHRQAKRQQDPAVSYAETKKDHVCVDVHHSDRETKVLYEETEFYGHFNFRDTILDQLDRQFVYLDRMKHRAPDAYEYYRQVGATVLPYMAVPCIREREKAPGDRTWVNEVSPWFREVLPAFGCIAIGANPEAERREEEESSTRSWLWIPRFVYFVKYNRRYYPSHTQRLSPGSTPYSVTVWWDRANSKRKSGVPQEFMVEVSPSGTVRALKVRGVHFLHPPGRGRNARAGAKAKSIPQRRWHIPQEYEEWAGHHDAHAPEFLANLFCNLTETVERASGSMIMVSVEKEQRHAIFSVDVNRMPYFFSDRDYFLTKAGFRKPIFHSVRPHQLKSGAYRKLHFRGQREFTWAGYKVLITVPGLHHPELDTFNIGAADGRRLKKGEPTEDMGQIGARLRGMIEKGMPGFSTPRAPQ